MWTEDLYYSKEAISSHSPLTVTMAGVTICDGTYRVIRENSSFSLFEYILEGEGAVKVGSHYYIPRKGDVYILHSGSSYEYYSSAKNPWKKIWFTVTGSLVGHLVQAYGLHIVHLLNNAEAQPFFEQILNMLKDGDSSDSARKFSPLFHELLIHISESIDRTGKEFSPIALKMKNYLDGHIEEKVTLDGISEQLNKSHSQLIRIFKQNFHLTPYEYLLNLRIETAKHLLHNTNYPIKEIAFKLQFSDEHYFSNFFKAREGVSPSRYKMTSPIKYV